MSADDMECLGRDDESGDDRKLLSAATARIITDKGNRHGLSDVADDVGIDLNEFFND